MKYLVLLYAEEGAWPPEEHKAAIQKSVDLCHELHAKGQYRGAAPLQPPSTATYLQVRNDRVMILDGPFSETKEHLGGYFLIDVDSLDEAIVIASRIPGATRGTAEIRPIMEVTGLPDEPAIGSPR